MATIRDLMELEDNEYKNLENFIKRMTMNVPTYNNNDQIRFLRMQIELITEGLQALAPGNNARLEALYPKLASLSQLLETQHKKISHW
jgi:hypothetical protein